MSLFLPNYGNMYKILSKITVPQTLFQGDAALHAVLGANYAQLNARVSPRPPLQETEPLLPQQANGVWLGARVTQESLYQRNLPIAMVTGRG